MMGFASRHRQDFHVHVHQEFMVIDVHLVKKIQVRNYSNKQQINCISCSNKLFLKSGVGVIVGSIIGVLIALIVAGFVIYKFILPKKIQDNIPLSPINHSD